MLKMCACGCSDGVGKRSPKEGTTDASLAISEFQRETYFEDIENPWEGAKLQEQS